MERRMSCKVDEKSRVFKFFVMMSSLHDYQGLCVEKGICIPPDLTAAIFF